MRTRILVVLLLVAAVLPFAGARPASAWSLPSLDVALGKSHPGRGTPYDGGLSFAVAPMWTAGDHAQFGLSYMADDIGDVVVPLYDRNSGSPLGTAAKNHGWTWALAWRGDLDVVHRANWGAAVTGNIGYWRVVDDVHGQNTNAASDVGLGLGADVMRKFAHTHEYGVAVRWQRLYDQRASVYHRIDSYTTVALEWRWLAPEHD